MNDKFQAISESASVTSPDGQSQKENRKYSNSSYPEATSDVLRRARYRDNTGLRKCLALWSAGLVTLWMAAVMVVLFVNYTAELCLSNRVLIVLLSTTTLNVIGIVLVTMKDLFNGRSEEGMR